MRSVGKRRVLIVEDNEINREILCEILADHYDIMQAENGQKGMEILKEYGDKISLVLLDIMMPVMDGYAFLDCVREIPELSAIPIIVMTANNAVEDEALCLSKGASDFVSKPYNAEIVKLRVDSLIKLRESSTLLHLVEFDALTGVYSKELFYQRAARVLELNPDVEFDIICSDIEYFKMINERHGHQKGDELLQYIAECFTGQMDELEICGRISADTFAGLCVHRSEDALHEMAAQLRGLMVHSPVSNVSIKFGVYQNVERDKPVSLMCDHALLALGKIKHLYGTDLALYDDSLRQAMLREQEVLNSMERALKEEQFVVYYQPKYDLQHNRIGGAEALVRWIHPEFGFMNPGMFIPLFERSGFISQLDRYVWEHVCRDIQAWRQAGLPVVPISANVSRADFDIDNLAQQIELLADCHEVPHALLHLEITESAYTDNPKQIKDVVEQLRSKGFGIELDDFGSGYSSLNMLDDLTFDVLKLDMSLVRKIESVEEKHNVLSFVLRMADMLSLKTVAEGVETEMQVEHLRNLGCTYAQGYFYAKPMPKEAFVQYLLEHQ